MKSVESVSNLLRSPINASRNLYSHNSNSSERSLKSISSVTARRFAALNKNRGNTCRAQWIDEESIISVPLETFIDADMLSATCQRAAIKIKVCLSELIPLDGSSLGAINYDIENYKNTSSNNIKSLGQRLERIGETEIIASLLRPLEVSLRTHNLSPRQSLLQINLHHNNNTTSFHKHGDQMDTSCFENQIMIEKVDLIVQSEEILTSTDPAVPNQLPFTFESMEGHPQVTRSILYYWNLLSGREGKWVTSETDNEVDFLTLRVELTGKLATSQSQVFLSFESTLSQRIVFPEQAQLSGIQISESRIINNSAVGTIKVLEAFQIELILKNYHSEVQSACLTVIQPQSHSKSKSQSKFTGSEIKDWLKMERAKKCPSLLLTAPLQPVRIENLPPGGSKALRIQFVPARRDMINLNDEFKILIDDTPVLIGINFIKVE